MAKALRLGVALLAAGSSRRFGDADKLEAMLKGKPLGEHAADALPMERCSAGWVIVSRIGHQCEAAWRARGLSPAVNEHALQGMGTSVALAAGLAKSARCDALLIALADMPFVPQTHFEALIEGFENGALIAVSGANGTARMPPAIFDAAHFDELQKSSGDKGARSLIGAGLIVASPAEWLVDIDTPESLAAHDCS